MTTPPCSEGLKWLVLPTPQTVDEEQLLRFQTIFPFNARPIQPLNGRSVWLETPEEEGEEHNIGTQININFAGLIPGN